MCKGGTVSKITPGEGGGRKKGKGREWGGLNVKISPGVCDSEIDGDRFEGPGAGCWEGGGGSKGSDSLTRRETFV